jgi:hypothetical protein
MRDLWTVLRVNPNSMISHRSLFKKKHAKNEIWIDFELKSDGHSVRRSSAAETRVGA